MYFYQSIYYFHLWCYRKNIFNIKNNIKCTYTLNFHKDNIISWRVYNLFPRGPECLFSSSNVIAYIRRDYFSSRNGYLSQISDDKNTYTEMTEDIARKRFHFRHLTLARNVLSHLHLTLWSRFDFSRLHMTSWALSNSIRTTHSYITLGVYTSSEWRKYDVDIHIACMIKAINKKLPFKPVEDVSINLKEKNICWI